MSKSVEKGNLQRKIFSDNAEWSSKKSKIPGNVKTEVKQNIKKKTGSCIL